MNTDAIRKKFGNDFIASENTFIMGIDRRFTTHFAKRFKGLSVLETCSGAGFSTISLAKSAKHVFTVEVEPSHLAQAIQNVKKAGLLDQVTFIEGDILDRDLLESIPFVDAAFIDPDWAVTGPDHEYRFHRSNTKPPADIVLNRIFKITSNAAIVLPPFIDERELAHLPEHEREKLYMDGRHELFCLYFGNLKIKVGNTDFCVP